MILLALRRVGPGRVAVEASVPALERLAAVRISAIALKAGASRVVMTPS